MPPSVLILKFILAVSNDFIAVDNRELSTFCQPLCRLGKRFIKCILWLILVLPILFVLKERAFPAFIFV